MSLDLGSSVDVRAGDRTAGLGQRWRVLLSGPGTPDRLRRVGAVLVLGCLLSGVVGLVEGLARTGAVHEGSTRIAAVHADAAEVYRSLADATRWRPAVSSPAGRSPRPACPLRP
ncbi:hypothetical protein BJF90_43175 [Pseudonocardia sp. CNS-004]|nr:hypothetical protein BJF90_43175 [Pseudonocardia sp. CNS-004]